MTDNNTWPGKPGVPLNPERGNTWHWLRHGNGEIVPRWWSCSYWQAVGGGGCANIYPHEAAKAWPGYLGPCLTPAELESRVTQARRNALEEAALAAENEPEPENDPPPELHGRSVKNIAIASVRATKRSIAAAIRALKGEGDE